MSSGVYFIRVLGCDKIYIGSTSYFKGREKHHLRHLKANKHSNRYLQNAINKYGIESFRFEIKEIVDDLSLLIKREQFYIDSFSSNKLFNIRKIAERNAGVKKSDKAKQEISKKLTGRKHSDGTRKKISEARKGIKRSDETKKKISETRKKMSEVLKGKRLSDETRKKISESLKRGKQSNIQV